MNGKLINQATKWTKGKATRQRDRKRENSMDGWRKVQLAYLCDQAPVVLHLFCSVTCLSQTHGCEVYMRLRVRACMCNRRKMRRGEGVNWKAGSGNENRNEGKKILRFTSFPAEETACRELRERAGASSLPSFVSSCQRTFAHPSSTGRPPAFPDPLAEGRLEEQRKVAVLKGG
mmetsp:Transcript_8196/g.15978  ORF Transcript_8196/g.15978 Transcript_8196/m.15978 type:complete len:174 (-) Transcript_8196:74-595(-)